MLAAGEQQRNGRCSELIREQESWTLANYSNHGPLHVFYELNFCAFLKCVVSCDSPFSARCIIHFHVTTSLRLSSVCSVLDEMLIVIVLELVHVSVSRPCNVETSAGL